MAEALQLPRRRRARNGAAPGAHPQPGPAAAGAAALPAYLRSAADSAATADAQASQEQAAVQQAQAMREQVASREAPAPASRAAPALPLYRAAAAAPGPADRQLIARRAAARHGGGQPLPAATRPALEHQFGQSLSAVRVHTDAEARVLCHLAGTRAFTWQSDIFMGDGAPGPASPEGAALLAHELTHVLQQAHTGPQLQREDNPTTESEADITLTDGTLIERERRAYPGSAQPRKRILLPEVSLPDFKGLHGDGFPRVLALRPHPRQAAAYRTLWRDALRMRVTALLQPQLTDARIAGGVHRDSDTYFFMGSDNPALVLFGTPEELVARHLEPFWSQTGALSRYQIDHIIEDQLVNPADTSLSETPTADILSNLQLLDANANMSSGRLLQAEINRRLRHAVTLFATEHPNLRPLTFEGLRHGYYVNFLHHDFSLRGTGGDTTNTWSFDQLNRGGGLARLVPMRGDQMRALNREDEPTVFTSAAGGMARHVRASQLPQRNWLPRVNLTGIEISPDTASSDEAGWITVEAFNARDGRSNAVAASYPAMRWRLRRVPGIYGGAIDLGYLRDNYFGARTSLQLPGLSPLSFDNLSLGDDGLRAEGRVLPTVPLVRDADIRIALVGDEVQLYKTFTGPELALPRPFRLLDTSLTVLFSSHSGLGVEGRVGFEVQRLGQGHLEGSATTGRGFALEGGFDFDSSLFDRAHIEAWYRDEQFGAAGELAIETPGKVRGIRAARVAIRYDAGSFQATGSVQPDIPGVQQAGLTVAYSEDQGLTIGGNLQLTANPAIRSGSVDVTLRKPDDRWLVQASGTAVPAIPGLASELTVTYDDGAFDARFQGAFERGMLSGTVEAGATNRPVDAQGQPGGEAQPGAPLVVYGGGSATLRLAPWLQGTAGLRFSPDGEVTVQGEIGLPSSLSLFDRREVQRRLFGVAVQVPIVPGIVAEVGGNLTAVAGIGPGMLEQLRIAITYNPSHEEDTHVTGDAHLRVPADAGLRLGARAGIGLGIPGASATGGIELGGMAGIAGAAEASVHIDWRPGSGLAIDAQAALHAEPVFRFDVSGYVSVQALGFSVYDERWQLAAMEVGSGLALGVRFPVHYRQGQPFDVAMDDVQFDLPPIDTMGLVRQVLAQVA